jgi:hypothetical protein
MLELHNRTPFPAAIVPGLDKEGVDTVTVVVKGTFALGRREALEVADAQVPITHADEFHGEPGISSIKYEADACPAKKGTDIVLLGHAWSLHPVPSLDVSLAVGRLRKVVRVFGDRAWWRTVGGAAISDPIKFARMPLVYERAFGGGDLAVEDPDARPRDPRNPVGVGFTSATDPERIEGVFLPNLEDPEAIITSPHARPAPAGFGFIGRDWLPRRAFAGTYDEAWRHDRAPLLPADFDERYFNAAHPSLTSPRPLRGGEAVALSNASESGDLRFQVPASAIAITARIRRAPVDLPAALDTLLIEPDAHRVVVTWRATAPCPRSFLYIEHVRIAEKRAA